MKYRPHRETLQESMAEVIELDGLPSLVKFLREDGYAGDVEVKPYCFDERNGWDTHIVTVDGKAVGYTDQKA